MLFAILENIWHAIKLKGIGSNASQIHPMQFAKKEYYMNTTSLCKKLEFHSLNEHKLDALLKYKPLLKSISINPL